jgi:hypothetical protein
VLAGESFGQPGNESSSLTALGGAGFKKFGPDRLGCASMNLGPLALLTRQVLGRMPHPRFAAHNLGRRAAPAAGREPINADRRYLPEFAAPRGTNRLQEFLEPRSVGSTNKGVVP